MPKYWEAETPQTIVAPKNQLQYYPKAGKLAVSRPSWTDDNGAERQGKTVTLDVSALLEADRAVMEQTRGVLAAIVEKIDAQLAVI